MGRIVGHVNDRAKKLIDIFRKFCFIFHKIKAPCNATSNPCQNNGVCINTLISPTYKGCSCLNGFTGATCQIGKFKIPLKLPKFYCSFRPLLIVPKRFMTVSELFRKRFMER